MVLFKYKILERKWYLNWNSFFWKFSFHLNLLLIVLWYLFPFTHQVKYLDSYINFSDKQIDFTETQKKRYPFCPNLVFVSFSFCLCFVKNDNGEGTFAHTGRCGDDRGGGRSSPSEVGGVQRTQDTAETTVCDFCEWFNNSILILCCVWLCCSGWCCELCCSCCCSCCEWENEYKILADKEHIYEAREHTNCCCLNFCGVRRSFEMTFTEPHQHDNKTPVFELERPFHCRTPCLPCDCCHQEVRVHSGNRPIGRVVEMCWCCSPTLHVYNPHGELTYKLIGDNMCLRCCNCFYWCCRCCPEYIIKIKDPKTDK